MEEIGVKLPDNYATQILDHGFFHADPHPGNLIIRGGQIVYIDLGIMGRAVDARSRGLGDIIKAVGVKDSAGLKEALIRYAVQKDNAAIDHRASSPTSTIFWRITGRSTSIRSTSARCSTTSWRSRAPAA